MSSRSICPPLRERIEDIPLLVNTFVQRLRERTQKEITGLTPAAMEHFMRYHWPGNVRELKSAMEFAFVIAGKGLIDLDQLPPNIVEPKLTFTEPILRPLPPIAYKDSGEIPIVPAILGENAEKKALVDALRQCNGNQTQAARILGINRVTVWNRMKKYRIELETLLRI